MRIERTFGILEGMTRPRKDLETVRNLLAQMFSNQSEDIRRIFTDACDRADIEWRQSNAWTISVSRRGSVDKLDRFIGPKS